MLQAKVIMLILKIVMWGVGIGVGIWYLSSSISGASITYVSLDSFLTAIGMTANDISTVNGCFLCGYLERFFAAIGRATENFWIPLVNGLWIVMAIGFGLFIFISGTMHVYEATKKTAEINAEEKKIEFKPWFDKVWKQGVRILIVGVLLGALGAGGTSSLKMVTNLTVTPVLFFGSELSMVASGVSDAAQCGAMTSVSTDVLSPVVKPFMCVMGNLNTVMLAGAAGGFSLMNYAYLDMGGGVLTWISGLGIVILFLLIGFNLIFQILNVIFKLIFLIMFLPIILAAGAFENTWKMASGVVPNAIGMLVKSSLKIVSITLKIVILYATFMFAADEFMPPPVDGYTAVLPPLLGMNNAQTVTNPDALSVMDVFKSCEAVSLTDGVMDKDKFKSCFTAERAKAESVNPGAFDFMDNGFEFLLLIIGLYLMYTYVISKRIDAMLPATDDEKEFNFGTWIKGFGSQIAKIPTNLIGKFIKK